MSRGNPNSADESCPLARRTLILDANGRRRVKAVAGRSKAQAVRARRTAERRLAELTERPSDAAATRSGLSAQETAWEATRQAAANRDELGEQR